MKQKPDKFHNAMEAQKFEGRDLSFMEHLQDMTGRKKTEEALRKSEQKYRQLFEASPISLWEVDFSAVKQRIDELKKQGIKDFRSHFEAHPELVQELAGKVKIVDVNLASLALYQATSKEELFAGLPQLFADESYSDFMEKLLNLAEGNTKYQAEKKHLTLAGDPIDVQLYWSVVPGHEETYFRVLVSIIDVTEAKQKEEELQRSQKQLQEQKYFLESILDHAPIGIWLVDTEQTPIIVNKSFQDNTGFGTDNPSMTEEEIATCKETDEKTLSRGEPQLYEEVITFKDGAKHVLQTIKTPLYRKDGGILGVLGLGLDITGRKQTEEKLADYTRQLEKLNRQLDEEMNKAHRIHSRTLPAKLPEVEGVSLETFYQPAQRLGGDFYNLIKSDNKLMLYFSDVMGHGVDGAMLSIFVKEAIDSYVSLNPAELKPEKILRHLDRQYRRETFPEEYLICIFLAVLDLETLELSYCGAGFQSSPLVRTPDGAMSRLTCRGLPISSVISAELMQVTIEHLTLTPGTTILFATDGLTEQNVNGEYYNEHLPRVFLENSNLPPSLIAKAIKEDFRAFNEGSLQGDDDLTFCVLQVDPENKDTMKLELNSRLEELRYLHERSNAFLPESEKAYCLIGGLHETVANAMEHGNQLDPNKKVFVEIALTDEYMAAIVEDQGEGFNWQDKLNDLLDLRGAQDRGRGVLMTNMFCDRFFYNEKGNRALLLVKGDASKCK